MDEDTFTFALAPVEFTSLRIALRVQISFWEQYPSDSVNGETLLSAYIALFNKTELNRTGTGLTLSRSELNTAFQAVRTRAIYWLLSDDSPSMVIKRYSDLTNKLLTILRGE